jgi:hypothetical protein
VVANGVVCLAAEDGTLCARKATTGQQLATTTIGAPPSRPPRSRTGTVYVGAIDQRLPAHAPRRPGR